MKYSKKYFATFKQVKQHKNKYSKYCNLCVLQRTHTAEQHQKSMKFQKAYERRLARISSHRGILSWNVQISSIKE